MPTKEVLYSKFTLTFWYLVNTEILGEAINRAFEKRVLESIQAVNPFLSRIPEHLIDEYNRDCQAAISNGNLCVVSEETDEVTFSYSLITVYATKPNFNHQP